MTNPQIGSFVLIYQFIVAENLLRKQIHTPSDVDMRLIVEASMG